MNDNNIRRRISSKSITGEPGASGMSVTELLAVMLQRGPSSAPALELSRHLLTRFGGLRQLVHAEPDELAREHGVGDVRIAMLRAIPELARRYFEETLPEGTAIRSPRDTENFLLARLRDRPHEVFCCLYLDNRHRVILFEELFRGTIDGTSVYPREIVKQALSVNAAAIILAHNHC